MSPRKCRETDCHIGRRIRSRRIAAGLSQEQLGAKLGLTFQQVQKYESGTNRVSASRLFDLSNLFGVPLDDFFAGLAPTEAGGADASQDPTSLIATRDDAALIREISAAPVHHRRALLEVARTLASTRHA
jgi:transcriptional regulator with XRE-family HTH domain